LKKPETGGDLEKRKEEKEEEKGKVIKDMEY